MHITQLQKYEYLIFIKNYYMFIIAQHSRLQNLKVTQMLKKVRLLRNYKDDHHIPAQLIERCYINQKRNNIYYASTLRNISIQQICVYPREQVLKTEEIRGAVQKLKVVGRHPFNTHACRKMTL